MPSTNGIWVMGIPSARKSIQKHAPSDHKTVHMYDLKRSHMRKRVELSWFRGGHELRILGKGLSTE